MSIKKQQKSIIINANGKNLAKRLESLAMKYPNECYLLSDDTSAASRYVIPESWFKIEPKKKRNSEKTS